MMKREQGSSDAVTGLIESIEHGGILVLVMTAPRRNRLMASLRAALGTALDRASSSPAIRAVLITGAAGDFSEGRGPALPQPDGAPGLEKLCARIADLGKPVVAALDGAVLDGGMDIALAASVRLAAPGASLGFPGVARGLVPEGGGGQRLARLAGADTALRLLLTGVPVRAAAALALGLVDLVVPARHLPATALERARALADAAEAVVDAGAVPADAGQNSGQNPGLNAGLNAGLRFSESRSEVPGPASPPPTGPPQRRNPAVRRRAAPSGRTDPVAFQAAVAGARQGLGADSPDGFSPRDASAADLAARIVDCIEAAQLLPAAAALDFERIAFEDCLVSEAAAGLCHLATARETAADLGVLRRRIGALPHRVAVIGAGGADLAGRLLGSGAEVVLCEPDTGALARAVQRIAARQDQAVRVRSLEPERRAALQAMLTPVADLRGMGDATFAFVFGTAGRRPSEALVRRLDRLLPPLAVMALASASGSPDALAAASGRPGAVVGFQIYGSAGVQPLAEVIPHAQSTPVAGALSAALLQAAGLSTVMAGRVVAATALPSVDALDPARAPLLLSAVGDMPQAAAKPAYTLRTASPPFGTRPDGMTASGPAGQGLAAPGLSAQSSAGRGPGGDWTDALGSGARAPGSGGSGADGTGAVDPRAARLPVASPGAFSPGAFNPGAFSPGSDGLGSDGLGSDGLGNPLLDGWRIAAFSLLTDGATPAGVDAVARAAGHAFGPFRQMDEAGLDTVLARLRGRLTGESLPLIGHLCAAGWNGRRGGRGFFRYDGVTAVEDQDVNALLRDDIAARGLAAQRMSAATGLRRLHLGLIVAGARLVASGVARQSGDVDLVAQQATGAPPRWGGPLHAADRAGLAAVLTDLRKLAAAAAESGKGTRGIVDFWTPPELLVDLVKSGGRFADAPQAGRPGRGGGRRNAQPASRIGAAPPVAGPTATQRPAG